MDARSILTCLGRVPPLTAIWGDSHTIVQQRCWCYDNRSHAWEDNISRLGEISLTVLMPTIVCGCHDTLHLAAGRRMHLRLEGSGVTCPTQVWYRVKREFRFPHVEPSLYVRGTALLKWLTWKIKLETRLTGKLKKFCNLRQD